MKAICIDNTNYEGDGTPSCSLTIGKVYDVSDFYNERKLYKVINDDMVNAIYQQSRFINLSKIRNDKLKELGI